MKDDPDQLDGVDWVPPFLHGFIYEDKPEMLEWFLDLGANIELPEQDFGGRPLSARSSIATKGPSGPWLSAAPICRERWTLRSVALPVTSKTYLLPRHIGKLSTCFESLVSSSSVRIEGLKDCRASRLRSNSGSSGPPCSSCDG